ncbi:Dual specificity phosphatase [Dirofilaria immitis]|nr:Dual specificity phosphatase [Dirofilaria immitis]
MVIVETNECNIMTSTSFLINSSADYGQITELVPRLYIGDANSLSLDNMKKYNISLIINATTEVRSEKFFSSMRLFGSISQIELWLDDTPSADIYQYFDLISDQVIKNGISSVKFVRSRKDPESVLPNVYLSSIAFFSLQTFADLREDWRFSKDKLKFQLMLETAPESIEAGA